ncbi:hypothetical protein ACFWXO_39505 [Kitasatospora sp. NPDC059088]|uniref:hypothetical protein n=1 Tax=Kitasatospora sp. NPDC059088 TaxID=3346722 RepID=UPI0036C3DAAD
MVFDAVVNGLDGARAAAVTVPVVIAAVARRWLRYREAVRREAERTRQVETAVAGTESRHRAAVMAASAWLREPPRTHDGHRSTSDQPTPERSTSDRPTSERSGSDRPTSERLKGRQGG